MTSKRFSRSLPLASLLVGLACTNGAGNDAQGDTGESETGDGDGDGDWPEIRSEQPHDQDPMVEESEATTLAADNHALGLDVYHAVREGDALDASFSISPWSIQSAFAMLQGGTVEPAASETAEVLHFSLAGERLHVGFNWVDAQLRSRNLPAQSTPEGEIDPVIVETANGVWILDLMAPDVEPAYLDLLSIHYDTGLYLADFPGNTEPERMAINAWVADRTHDLIPELFAAGVIKSSTTMVLVNALYLKAPWADPFEPESTIKAPFTRLDDSVVEVDMMSKYELTGSYGEGTGWRALAVPLRGDALEMVIIVPDEFTTFEAALDQTTLDEVFAALTWSIVTTELPRFRIESAFGLVDELMTLGMQAPFADPASFAGIVPGGPGVITEVIHKTVLSVDEKGTEAAAATGIVIGEDGSPGPDHELTVDRPFLVVIRDEPSDTVLFLGRVLDPSV